MLEPHFGLILVFIVEIHTQVHLKRMWSNLRKILLAIFEVDKKAGINM